MARFRAILNVALGLGVCLIAGAAQAGTWIQAETDRFIVTGEVPEKVIRDYATRLTTFDAALRIMHPSTQDAAPIQKVQVYLVKDRNELRRVWPGASDNVAGFYAPRPAGSFALANIGAPGRYPEIILYHEYAHHFMRANFAGVVPPWLSEGWADYFGATLIDDKKVTVGALGRSGVLFSDKWLPMEDVLSKTTSQLPESQRVTFYAQAWLLVHYMMADSPRRQQLSRILSAVGRGQPSMAAFTEVTGMTGPQLTQQLKAYQKITTESFNNPLQGEPAMTVSRLPATVDAFLLDRLHAVYGGGGDQSAFVARVRTRAADYPDDAFAQATLAQVEFTFGDDATAEAVIDKLLAKDPNDLDALRTGALGLAYAAGSNPARRVEWFAKARTLAARGYGLSKDDPGILYAYVLARRIQPGYPTANDVATANRAMMLAPSVGPMMMLAGEVLMRSGKRPEGRALLEEVANDPHGGGMAEAARRIIIRNSDDVGEALGKAAQTMAKPSASESPQEH